MKTEIKEINSFTRELSVTVSWENLVEGFNKEVEKARSGFDLKGFRKGNVPVNIVKKRIGPSIEAHFAEHSLNDYYRKALDELSLNPINQAKISKLHFHEGSDLDFIAEFEVTPEVKLPNYEKKYKIKTVRYFPTSQDVEKALKDIREQHATIKTIEDGARTGHFINGDFQELDEFGAPINGRKLEKQYIKLGEAAFSGDAEKPFLGVKAHDKVTTCVVYDGDKSIHYQVDVHKVEEQILPGVDDEFAKMADESVASVSELNTKLETQIQTSLDKEHEKEIQKQIMDYFVKKSKVDPPSSMIENFLNHVIEDVKKQNENNEEVDEEKIREVYEEQAENSVKWYLIKDNIIESANLDVSDEYMDEKIKAFISDNETQKDQIKKFYRQTSNRKKLYEDLLSEKLFEHLKEYATNKVTKKSTDELKKGKK